ncbi:MAG TPA: hypothetical protein VNH11_12540 [Pirellulales bacterium]|nr:hypothetical protein [Pirellulales bacterium]
MKKLLLPFLALALLAFHAPAAKAEDESSPQPVVVATFSGYAELKRDLEYLGTLSGNPDMAKGLEQLLMLFTQNQGLAGLDKGRPWGASLSVTPDGSQFPLLAFLPVTDLKELLDALAAIIGEADDAGDDVYKIKRGTNTLFITQKGKWAYIAQQKSVLEDAPGNPLKPFRGLEKQYDLAVSVHVQSIPQALRDMAADLLKQGLETGLQQNLGDDEQAELKAKIARTQAESLVKGINEVDQITVGLNIDREESRTYLDIAVTALEGTDTAKQIAASSEEAEDSRMAGFLLPDAIASLHLNTPVADGEEQEEQIESMLEGLRTQLFSEIDDEDDLDDEQKAKAKELAGDLFEVLEETLEEEGRLNAGIALVGEKPFTLVAGVLVADAAELEKIAKEFITLAAEDAELPKPKFNVEKYKGHRFHALSVPVDDDAENAEQLKQALGDPVRIVMAFGEDTFYIAVGEEGPATIKRVIDKSAEGAEKDPAPMRITLALAPVLKLVSSQNGNPMAAMLAESLKGGKDHVSITLENIENGVRYRIEAEEGVNKLLGTSLGSGLRAGGAGGR